MEYRTELKYKIRPNTYAHLINLLQDHSDPDPFNPSSYLISNLYFDSVELDAYLASVDGNFSREKMRIRSYDNFKSQNFFELKFKKGNRSSKLRSHIDDHVDFDRSSSISFWLGSLENNRTLLNLRNWRPILWNRYERRAFVSKKRNSRNWRITFDRHIEARKYVFGGRGGRTTKVADGFLEILMEIKFEKYLDANILNMVAGLERQRTTFSKYCQSVEKLRLAI